LVLDWVDGTLGSPVDGVSKVGGVELNNVLVDLIGGWGLESEELFVLIMGPGGEHVVSNGEGVSLLSVDLSDLLVLLGEDLHSEVVLLLGSIGFSIGGEMLVEESLNSEFLRFVVAVVRLESEEGGGFAKVKHVCLV